MIIKGLTDEDFVNYKQPSMVVIFPKCSFKCDKDCGQQVCQNSALATAPILEIPIDIIVSRYLRNPITTSLVCAGLEPFDSWNELIDLVKKFRAHTEDTVIIYTGYFENEIEDKIDALKHYPNIIIKFGRFVPNQKKHLDKVLGVNLASDDQFAKQIS